MLKGKYKKKALKLFLYNSFYIYLERVASGCTFHDLLTGIIQLNIFRCAIYSKNQSVNEYLSITKCGGTSFELLLELLSKFFSSPNSLLY